MRKYVVLTRKDLIIMRKYVVLMRKDLVITRKDVVLTRKDLVITTYLSGKHIMCVAAMRHRSSVSENALLMLEVRGEWPNLRALSRGKSKMA